MLHRTLTPTAAALALMVGSSVCLPSVSKGNPAPTRVIKGEEALLTGIDTDTDAALRLRRIR